MALLAKTIILLDEPFTAEKMRKLHVGDLVFIRGTIFTARDAVHRYLYDGGKPPVSLRNKIIYHCGPVVVKSGSKWKVKAAGPTTSAREEPHMAKLVERLGIRGIIGKGGMGASTLEACKKFGCVYFSAIGGAAQALAAAIKEVKNVYLLKKLGTTEAMWEFSVRDFPAVVTMDAHGRSLHQEVLSKSQRRLRATL